MHNPVTFNFCFIASWLAILFSFSCWRIWGVSSLDFLGFFFILSCFISFLFFLSNKFKFEATFSKKESLKRQLQITNNGTYNMSNEKTSTSKGVLYHFGSSSTESTRGNSGELKSNIGQMKTSCSPIKEGFFRYVKNFVMRNSVIPLLHPPYKSHSIEADLILSVGHISY